MKTRRIAPIAIAAALAACSSPKRTDPPAKAAPPVVSSVSVPVPESAALDVGPLRPPWAAEYPATRVADVVERHFGVDVHDPYRWLEDGRSAEVKSWVDAQDALTRRHLDALPERAALLARLRELVHYEARSAAYPAGGRLFFETRSTAQEKSVLRWRGRDGVDHVLLDPNTWPAKDNPSLSEWQPSTDGRKVAYVVSLHNADRGALHVVDVATGVESVRDAMPDVYFPAVSWAPAARGFYYTFVPPSPHGGRPAQELAELRYHRLGDVPDRDTIVREKTGDRTSFLWPQASRDGHWLLALIAHGDVSTEIYSRDLRGGARSSGSTGWATLTAGDHGVAYPRAYRDRFYVLTNKDAPNWRIEVVDPAHPQQQDWKVLVPERADARLEDFAIVGGRLVLKYLRDVVTHLEIHELDGSLVREIELPGPGTAYTPSNTDDDPESYLAFSSYTSPAEVLRLSARTGETSSWSRNTVAADLSPYTTEATFFQARDGTRVPIFIVRAKDFRRDGSAPALLGGYGGFNISYGPSFDSSVIPWLERGGIYAFANIRGGGEYGERWHVAGMKHAKQRVFDDFADAAEFLVREGYTKSERLVAEGRSNGGLLMGAITTQRPELFRAVICGAPLLDMVRFAEFGAGPTWVDEYGNPASEADFGPLLAYSPFHNVRAGARYPSFLMLSPVDDDRVDPLHARKMVAALQSASTGGPVFLRVEREAGHFGSDSRNATAERNADKYAFALAEIAKVGGSTAAH